MNSLTIKFTCENCGYVFEAKLGEYQKKKEQVHDTTYTLISCTCPNCHKTVAHLT